MHRSRIQIAAALAAPVECPYCGLKGKLAPGATDTVTCPSCKKTFRVGVDNKPASGDVPSFAARVRAARQTPRSTLNVVIEAKPTRLRIAASLPHAKTLVDELRAFRVKIDPLTANDSYSAWREKDHDDMVLSVALAVWLAEKFKAPAKYVDLTGAWSSGRPRLF